MASEPLISSSLPPPGPAGAFSSGRFAALAALGGLIGFLLGVLAHVMEAVAAGGLIGDLGL